MKGVTALLYPLDLPAHSLRRRGPGVIWTVGNLASNVYPFYETGNKGWTAAMVEAAKWLIEAGISEPPSP